MTYGKLKAAVRGIINRRDFTDQLAGDFINRAITELERVLRVGSMEQMFSSSAWDGTTRSLAIPSSFLEVIDLFTEEGGTLLQVSKDAYFAQRDTGHPAVFMRVGRSWLIKPAPAVGQTVFVHFYGETSPLVDDAEENLWTRTAFNAVLYGACSLAADYFQMEDQYVQRFQGKHDSLVEGLLTQDLSEKWAGPIAIGRPSGQGNY